MNLQPVMTDSTRTLLRLNGSPIFDTEKYGDLTILVRLPTEKMKNLFVAKIFHRTDLLNKGVCLRLQH